MFSLSKLSILLQVVILFSCSFSSVSAKTVQTFSNSTYGAVNIYNGIANLTWTISGSTVTFSLNIGKSGWFAIGLGPGMDRVDMAVIEVDGDSNAYVTDLWSTRSGVQPTADAKQDYTLLTQTVTATTIAVTYSRQLNTGDTKQDTILTPGQINVWCFAYGNTLRMLEKHKNYGLFDVVFSTPEPTPVPVPEPSNSTTIPSNSTDTNSSTSNSTSSDSFISNTSTNGSSLNPNASVSSPSNAIILGMGIIMLVIMGSQ